MQATWEQALYVCRNMREDDFAEVMATRHDDDRYSFAAECMRAPGLHLAATLRDYEPVAIGGIALWQPGVGQAWLVGTEKIGLIGLEVAKTCKRWIKHFFENGDLHRIQAFSSSAHTQAHQWLKAIGLKEEARMPCYGKKKEEFIIFSITKDDK